MVVCYITGVKATICGSIKYHKMMKDASQKMEHAKICARPDSEIDTQGIRYMMKYTSAPQK